MEVLDTIHRWQDRLYAEYGTHFVHASDEWYLLPGRKLPEEGLYDGYLQLENGLGMLRLLLDEFEEALEETAKEWEQDGERKTVSIATGRLAYPSIADMAKRLENACRGIRILVYPVTNEFFGERITVSGLLTGQDIASQLAGRELGERLLLPQNVLRSGEKVFLDDMTVEELENTLQVKVDIVKSSGRDFVDAVLYGNL